MFYLHSVNRVILHLLQNANQQVKDGFKSGLIGKNGGTSWTSPELLFESKIFIPALQQLVT
jgi:hypothetical protein